MIPRLPILLLLLAMVVPLSAENMERQKGEIDPRLGVLKQPYQKVEREIYLDGGSVGIEITDKDGRRQQFALPVHRMGNRVDYPKLYVGTMWVSPESPDPKAIAVSDPAATIKRLFEILASYKPCK